ncbi:MAG: hypothetical protein PHC28_00845 [Flavobacterium sp.]|uniref:hypothetical protein n=1 Tax=Flavobacterium sp. TaxID=239 RepID=UPI0026086087|nr:hypothetical protein [Flavobacterium sp.]MDD5149015.1 hypothetical protein [Flavobacterium sp.]
MDARKIELVDWLLHIEESKLKKIIALKSVLDKEVVAHTISGYPVDREGYINMVKEADERISSGKYTSIEDLEKEIENWCVSSGKEEEVDLSVRKYSFIEEIFKVEIDTFEKLEKILKKEKLNKIGVPSEHKGELDKRLESYRKNTQDLLDWDQVKKEW